MILDELMQGNRIFTVNEDGTETFTDRPPNRKELRAALEIQNLRDVRRGLETANATLQHELDTANLTIKEIAEICAQAEARYLELRKLLDVINQQKPVEINQENFGVAPE